MKKLKKLSIIFFSIVIIILLTSQKSFASNFAKKVKSAEYTEEYKKYLELSEEEREKVLQPKMFETIKTEAKTRNLFKLARSIGNSLETKYSLKDIIPNNVVIKNQEQTNTCWAFASLSSLETNLALNNKNALKVYDFSERHMEYATSRFFANDTINKNGYDRKAGSGGTWDMATAYLTNGSGAIDEKQMPFENNEDTIELKEIQNKTVTSQIYDTVTFPSYESTDDTTEIKQKMKEHIKNYGSISAQLHGATLNTEYYNNSTGAIYCNDKEKCPVNHGVSIIGWDEDYGIENFNENCRPKNKGAWIIKNSWGDKLEYTLSEMKTMIFENFRDECIQYGWTEASMIPDEFEKTFLTQNGYTIEGDKAVMKVGDNGFMYVSYEDVNIYSNLFGITKSANEVDYENVYQYDYFGDIYTISFPTNKLYLGNIFNKQTKGAEYLTQVSLYASETYTCTVYVNPNGSSKNKNDLQKVKLKAGDTETFNAGYHTLEFEKPIQIKGNDFAVVIEVQGTRPNEIIFSTEINVPNSRYGKVEIEDGKCFFTMDGEFEKNNWQDLSKMSQVNNSILDSDSSIKAFTVSKIDDDSLREIVITTPPVKTNYKEGEDFNKNGMVVTAYYHNGESREVTDYNITNGTNLKENQTNINITYENQTVNQTITVEKKVTEDDRQKPNPSNPEKITAENSNFENANFCVKELKYYTFTDKTKDEYIIMKIDIDGIEKKSNNDRYEYYYYISTNKNDTNIQNWVKIKKIQESKDGISFTIDTNDMENYQEVVKSNTTYLYIKEIAIKGGDQKVTISRINDKESNDGILEMYVDGVKLTNSNISNLGNNSNNSNNNGNGINASNNSNKISKNGNISSDNTMSAKKLPNAGGKAIVMFIVIVVILGGVLFVRYKNLCKYVK